MANHPVVGSLWDDNDFFAQGLEGHHSLVEDIADLDTVDMLVFWGGEDVHPRYYKETSRYAYVTNEAERDKFESWMFLEAIARNIPILGICRGAQLCCVMSGGKLWQDVKNHNHDHNIITNDGEVVLVTSTHHQMMRPGKGTEILAISEKVLSPQKFSQHGGEITNVPEPEICYNKLCNALMIQGHPEYSYAKPEFRQLTFKLIEKYLGDL